MIRWLIKGLNILLNRWLIKWLSILLNRWLIIRGLNILLNRWLIRGLNILLNRCMWLNIILLLNRWLIRGLNILLNRWLIRRILIISLNRSYIIKIKCFKLYLSMLAMFSFLFLFCLLLHMLHNRITWKRIRWEISLLLLNVLILL